MVGAKEEGGKKKSAFRLITLPHRYPSTDLASSGFEGKDLHLLNPLLRRKQAQSPACSYAVVMTCEVQTEGSSGWAAEKSVLQKHRALRHTEDINRQGLCGVCSAFTTESDLNHSATPLASSRGWHLAEVFILPTSQWHKSTSESHRTIPSI